MLEGICLLLHVFVLVIHIEERGEQQHQTFDGLLPIGSDSEDRHAVVHDINRWARASLFWTLLSR